MEQDQQQQEDSDTITNKDDNDYLVIHNDNDDDNNDDEEDDKNHLIPSPTVNALLLDTASAATSNSTSTTNATITAANTTTTNTINAPLSSSSSSSSPTLGVITAAESDDQSDTSSTSSLSSSYLSNTNIVISNNTANTTPPPSSLTTNTTILKSQQQQQQQQQQQRASPTSMLNVFNKAKRPNHIAHSRSASFDVSSTTSSSLQSDKPIRIGGEPQKERSKLEKMEAAAKSGNLVFLNNSLKEKPYIPLTQELSCKNTFLHVACKSLKIKTVTFILEKAPSLINAQNNKGRTPLHICCQEGFLHAANTLINLGANTTLTDYKKWTALHQIASHDLIKRQKEKQQQALLYQQQQQQQALLLQQQQQQQANNQITSSNPPPPPTNIPTPQPSDASIGFTIELILEISTKLLNGKGNLIGLKTSVGQTALHLAILSQNHQLCTLLLSHSTPETLVIKDDNGNTPLHLACYINRSKMSYDVAHTILSILAENLKGESLQSFIDDANNLMASALQIAMKVANTQLTRLVIQFRSLSEAKILEEYFMSLNSINPNDTTRLPLEQLQYNSAMFRNSSFGILFRKMVTILKEHYTINMTHQNPHLLLRRAKDTIGKFFAWLDRNISNYDYNRAYKEMIFSQSYDTIIHLYHETNKSKDIFFRQRISMFKDITHSELDITEESWKQNIEQFPKALATFKTLSDKRTPSEKIDTLNEATSQIIRMDANDLTPMFMFLIIQASNGYLQSEFQYMDDFKDTPEQEQYLLLLSGSLDYLETLNVTLRNQLNQVMSLSGIVDRTIDNALSLCDEFQTRSSPMPTSTTTSILLSPTSILQSFNDQFQLDDMKDDFNIQDELVLLLMMLSKLANRLTDDPIHLPMKWSDKIIKAYHFNAILERLGIKLDLSLESLLTNKTNDEYDNNNNNNNNNNNTTTTTVVTEQQQQQQQQSLNQKKGEICIIIQHPYPQMVYQVVEEQLRIRVLHPLVNK